MNPEQLRRRPATHSPKDRVLVVGSTSLQRAYTRWLFSRIDQHPGLFEFAQGDPEQILRRAVKAARDQRAMGSECQQVWALLDGVPTDEVKHLQHAARAARVSVVTSMPDFRTWLMLHLVELDQSPSAEALQGLSGTFAQPFRDYQNALAGRYKLARARAKALVGQSIQTDVYRLVDSVLSSTERFRGAPQIAHL